MRTIVCGLTAVIMMSTASAGERYIEIWNPPEARSAEGVHHVQAAHKAPNRRRPPAHVTHLLSLRRAVAATPAPAGPVQAEVER
jgi:hypothetical protein